MKILIETERLLLREITEADAPGLFELDSDPEVHKYLGHKTVTHLSESEDIVKHVQRQYLENGIGRWAVIDKATNEFIGWAGLKYEKNIRKNTHYYDLGYRLKRKFWGKGIAMEASVEALKYGFNQMNLTEIFAAAHTENAASNRILTKLGFTFIETFDYDGTVHNWYQLKKSTYAFSTLTDLAAERLGGKAISCSDDFFAEKENLLKPGRGIFIPDKYTDRGKWMDGWESRRKRTPGHDWCIVRLATSGKIAGVDIDTNHFLGNHPPFASLDACYLPDDSDPSPDYASWTEILPKSPLQAGSQNLYAIADPHIYTHVRLHIYPDGGVARLKIYGEVFRDWNQVSETEVIDLAAAIHGAKAILCNDMFFSHMDNLIMPGRGINMGDGWETKRNRTPNNRDWVVVRLAHRGVIDKILVDTCHFKGNYPDSCLIEGCNLSGQSEPDMGSADIEWTTILPQSKLQADHEHYFQKEITGKGVFTHIRLSIFPDGGVSRLRMWGTIKK